MNKRFCLAVTVVFSILFCGMLIFLGWANAGDYYVRSVSGTWKYRLNAWPDADNGIPCGSNDIDGCGKDLDGSSPANEMVIAAGEYYKDDLDTDGNMGVGVAAGLVVRSPTSDDPDYGTYGGAVVFNGDRGGANEATTYLMTTWNTGAKLVGLYFKNMPSGYSFINNQAATELTSIDNIYEDGDKLLVISGDAIFERDTFISGTSNLAIQVLSGSPSFRYCLFNSVNEIRDTGGTSPTLYNSTFKSSGDTVIRITSGSSAWTLKNNIIYPPALWGDGYVLNEGSTGSITISNNYLLPGPKNFDGYVSTGNVIDGGNNYGLDGGSNISFFPINTTHRRPAVVVLNIDDQASFEDWKTLSDTASSYNFVTNISIDTRQMTSQNWADLQTYVSAGHGVSSHGRSNYLRLGDLDVLDIQYDGAGTTATVSISAGVLTTLVDSSPDLSLTLSNYTAVTDLLAAIDADPDYSTNTHIHDGTKNQDVDPTNLAAVGATDIFGTTVTLSLDLSSLATDEIDGSKSDIESNLSGHTVKSFIWPGNSYSDNAITSVYNAGYLGAGGVHTDDKDLDGGSWNIYKIWRIPIPETIGTNNIERNIASIVEWLGHEGGIAVLYSHDFATFSEENWTKILGTLYNSNALVKTFDDAIDYFRNWSGGASSGDGKIWEITFSSSAATDFTLTPTSPARGAGADVWTGEASIESYNGVDVTDAAGVLKPNLKSKIDIGANQGVYVPLFPVFGIFFGDNWVQPQ